MARTSGASARVQRLIAFGATALLSVATAAAFGRVFSGPGVAAKLLLVALTSAIIASLFERRSLLLATLVSATAMLIVVAHTIVPETTWFGLPTLDTLEAIQDRIAHVGEQARVQVAPTAPLQPLMLAALTALWAAIFSAHALAFRAGSPLLALLPPVALVTFADTVLEGQVRPQYGLLFLIAGLAVAFSDGLRRIQGWGPVWESRGSPGHLYRDAGRSARKLGVMALVLAAFAPIMVPGFGAAGLVDLSDVDADDRISLSPLVSVASELKRSEPFEVFRVRSNRPTYHRMLALTDFNGSTWSAPSAEGATPLPPGSTLLPADVPDGPTLRQTYTITRSTLYPWLPVTYAPDSVDVDRNFRLDRTSTTIWLDGFLDAGDSYTTSSRLIVPTPEQLDQVEFPATARTEPSVRLPADLSADVAARITTLADRWTQGATSTYREILAIQDHLRDQRRFSYSTEVPARGDSFTIADFLTTTRTGYCQQFASAMAVLLRTRGIPARVAVGFTQGVPVPTADGETDVYRLTTDDYHVWVEVRFPGFGWLPFEPTPTRQNPVAVPYLAPTEPCAGTACPPIGVPGGVGTATPGLSSGRIQADLLERRERTSGPLPGEPTLLEPVPTDQGLSPRTWLAIAVGIGALLFAAAPLVRAWRRRHRLRRAGDAPRAMILAQYDVFTERARDLGLSRTPAETPEEFRRKIVAAGAISDGELDRLTSLAVAAAYGRVDPSDDDALDAGRAATETIRDLRRATPTGRRIAGLYRRTT